LAAIQNIGSIDVLCSDKTGTLTSGAMQIGQFLDPFGAPSSQLATTAYLNSSYETGIKSPLDAIILHQQPLPDITGYCKRDEIPFDFERRRLSVVVTRDGQSEIITKGAPESVLPVCATYQDATGVHLLDDAHRTQCQVAYQGLSAQGYRVLAVATHMMPDQASYHAADEANLTLNGFITFTDPPLPDAAEMIQQLTRDGVQLKIITGDNELVTRHVCTQVGVNVARIVLGEELDRMSDAALMHVVDTVAVFARVTPVQKNRIILALRRRKHVVGFIGDGINDAPSLHSADVGISVATAVDVARDAADVILLEPGLRVLHDGIIEGRKAFGNVIKYLLMGTRLASIGAAVPIHDLHGVASLSLPI
jgi:Mg2+-importing ATPase